MPRKRNSRNKSKREKIRDSIKESANKAKIRKTRKGPGKSKPLWKLEDGITYSALSKWIECPEQFSLAYIDGLSQKRISIPLEFGTIFHLCLEHQYNFPNLTPKQIANKVCNAYKKGRQSTLLNTRERETLENLINLVKVTFPAYCSYWEEDDQAIEWIQREDKFKVLHTIPTESGPVKVYLRGMRDGVIRIHGKSGIFETKTKSRIDESDIRDGLKADMQTMIYAFATYLARKEMPEYVYYNVIRRSTMYRRKDESITNWCNRISEDIQKRPSYYFLRW